MAAVQTTIRFPAKKNIPSISKKEKENRRSIKTRGKSVPDVERSPLKANSENNFVPCTPTKRKSLEESLNSSPPKQLKNLESPSQLIEKVSLVTPKSQKQSLSSSEPHAKIALFPDLPDCEARKALHRGNVLSLPGREDKIDELTSFLLKGLEDRKSRSVYISGQPGTGKTASIQCVTELPKISSGYKIVYINCTGLKSSGSIFSTIGKRLLVKTTSKSEKAYHAAIIKYLNLSKKMHLIILDEQDELASKGQQVLYSLMEWVSVVPNGLVMIGIANCLDLIDRALPRLASSSIKPLLIHFSPYSAKQITDIITHRLQETDNSEEMFEKGALHLLASKVSTVSGDVRKALDITARILQETDGKINIESVLSTFKYIYSTSETLCQSEDGFPLQQKLLICAFMLLKTKSKKKDSSIGKLHDVYQKICTKKHISPLDMSEFISLLELVESRGVLKLQGKTKSRMTKIVLQWDEKEVSLALKDKQLLSSIINDSSCL